jgi:hypothetical protein
LLCHYLFLTRKRYKSRNFWPKINLVSTTTVFIVLGCLLLLFSSSFFFSFVGVSERRDRVLELNLMMRLLLDYKSRWRTDTKLPTSEIRIRRRMPCFFLFFVFVFVFVRKKDGWFWVTKKKRHHFDSTKQSFIVSKIYEQLDFKQVPIILATLLFCK